MDDKEESKVQFHKLGDSDDEHELNFDDFDDAHDKSILSIAGDFNMDKVQ